MKQVSEETRRKMSEAAKARCTDEWRKRKSEATSTPLDPGLIRSLYESGMTQDEVASEMGVSQKVIWRAMKRFGIPTRPQKARNPRSGEQCHTWRGGTSTNANGYVYVLCKGHPRCEGRGKRGMAQYVPLHVLVMEQHLGRFLVWKGPDHPETEIVHHKNGNPADNRIDNLELTTYSEHYEKHGRSAKGHMRSLRNRGGDAACQQE